MKTWTCLPFIRSGQNHFERGKKTRQTEKEVERQHQGISLSNLRCFLDEIIKNKCTLMTLWRATWCRRCRERRSADLNDVCNNNSYTQTISQVAVFCPSMKTGLYALQTLHEEHCIDQWTVCLAQRTAAVPIQSRGCLFFLLGSTAMLSA